MTAAVTRGLQPAATKLPNGVHALAVRSPTTPAVTISAALHAGSLYDPADSPGLAHFLSRVVDRGTTQHAGEAIAEALDLRGVSLKVQVTRHALMLSCDCLTEDFDEVLALIGAIIREPTLPDDEVVSRRREILTALRQDDDNPAVTAVNRLMTLLYGTDHPYSHAPKGTAASLERVRREDLQAFHTRHVGPAGLSMVIVGDVPTDTSLGAVSAVFGDWSHDTPPHDELPPPPVPTIRQRIVVPMMGKAQADIAYGFTTVPRSDPSYYAHSLLVNILGQYGMGGRLGREIRERQGMAYYAFCGFEASTIAGPLLVRAGVNGVNVDRAVASIDEEIGRIARDGVTDTELADSKRYLIGSLPRTLETNAGIAAFLQNVQEFDLGLDYDQRLPSLLTAVTREEVGDVSARALSPDRAALVIAGPYEE